MHKQTHSYFFIKLTIWYFEYQNFHFLILTIRIYNSWKIFSLFWQGISLAGRPVILCAQLSACWELICTLYPVAANVSNIFFPLFPSCYYISSPPTSFLFFVFYLLYFFSAVFNDWEPVSRAQRVPDTFGDLLPRRRMEGNNDLCW